MVLQLIPKALVLGVITPTGMSGTDRLTPERINRAWAELAPRLGYTQLQFSADSAGATFMGPTPDDGVVIQPPLIQFRAAIVMTAEQAGDTAQSTIRSLVHHLGATDFQQLGVKLIYWAPMSDNDARGFVLRRIYRRTEDELAPLVGPGSLWVGAKFIVQQPTAAYTTLVEPLLRDARMLYLDVDAQFPGPADLDRIAERVRDVVQYLTQTVAGFLEHEQA